MENFYEVNGFGKVNKLKLKQKRQSMKFVFYLYTQFNFHVNLYAWSMKAYVSS